MSCAVVLTAAVKKVKKARVPNVYLPSKVATEPSHHFQQAHCKTVCMRYDSVGLLVSLLGMLIQGKA